jgi:hypothetical protein
VNFLWSRRAPKPCCWGPAFLGSSRCSEVTGPNRVTDEILTYGHVKPRNQWFLTKETPDQLLQDCLGPRGLYPSGTLVCTRRPRNMAKPRQGVAPAQGSGACPGFRLPIVDTPELGPWLLPDLRCQPRAGRKKTSPEPSRLEDSRTLCPGRGLAGPFRDRVTHEAWHKKTSFPRPPGAGWLLGPRVSPWS